MSNLARRLGTKAWSTWFGLRHRAAFAALGRTAFMHRPYRLDGAGGIELGDGASLQRGGWLYCVPVDATPARLRIGKGCDLGYNNHITCVREVTLGDHVLTGNNVYIADNVHAFEDITRPVMHQPVRFKRAVTIGSGAWLGENACIIGASVGRNCVIGANAVVTRDIPDFCIAVGIPAVVIRRFDTARSEWIDVPGNQ